MLLCAEDAAAARAGVRWLKSLKLNMRIAGLSGPLATSTAAMREARRSLGLPVLTHYCLSAPFIATALVTTTAS